MHTRAHRRSASDDLLIDDSTTGHNSDLPDNHLMGARGINVSAINRSVGILPVSTAVSEEFSNVLEISTDNRLQSSSPGGATLRDSIFRRSLQNNYASHLQSQAVK